MDNRNRIIAPVFVSIKNDKKIFDIDSLIKRTILFETYIINSEGLKEIPYLIRTFGFDGTIALLESKAVRLNCYTKTTASLGPTMFINEPSGSKVRPPFHYSFAQASTDDIYYNINISMREIEPKLDLHPRQIIRLRKAIYQSLEKPQLDGEASFLSVTTNELATNLTLLKKSISIAVKRRLGIGVDYQAVEVNVIRESEHDLHISSNLREMLNIDVDTAHTLVENACLSIAHCNDRFEQMKDYSALSGFNDTDLPIIDEKLSFLLRALSSTKYENNFQRVIQVAGLPQIMDDKDMKIDVKTLLKIRQSTEAMEFRQWLSTVDGLSDKEIISQVHSLSKIIGRFIGGTTGKNLRFLLTNGIGFFPQVGTAISLSLSVLDQFLVDKIFPRSGVSAFLDEMYPSLFD